jgi:hypothetical protein
MNAHDLDASDDWLEAALRADADSHAHAYIDDAGFSAKVMTALPPAIEPVPAWRKPVVAVIWGVAAAGAALAVPQVAIDVGREAFALLVAQRLSVPMIGVALAALGFGTWSAAAYALRHE